MTPLALKECDLLERFPVVRNDREFFSGGVLETNRSEQWGPSSGLEPRTDRSSRMDNVIVTLEYGRNRRVEGEGTSHFSKRMKIAERIAESDLGIEGGGDSGSKMSRAISTKDFKDQVTKNHIELTHVEP